MPRNEEGDFELILGNTQLLSVFFIVVVLLGIFFTMGYIVGRNSAPETATRAAARAPAEAPPPSPMVIDPGSQARRAAQSDETAERAAAKQPPALPPASAEPAPGQTFLQVSAVKKPEADLLVDVLVKKGFKARIAPVPGEADVFRVLVGPVENTTLAGTRADLEAAGFKSFPRKY